MSKSQASQGFLARAATLLDALVDWFLPAHLATADREMRQRARMFLISHICGPFIGNTVPLALWMFDPTPGFATGILAASITGFWVFPFILKAGGRYNVLAFLSVQNLIFCIFWSCYFYGGVTSPMLAWVLTIPLLAFFYLGSSPKLRVRVIALFLANLAGFYAVYRWGHRPVDDTPVVALQGLGLISTIAASLYVTMMALYYARILASGVELEAEMKGHLATAAELREATAMAQRAGIAKSEFVARMSHELRTPLNAVIGYSEMLLEDAATESPGDVADLQRIHGAGKNLLNLVDMVLDLSKIDAGKMELLPATVNVGAFLSGVVEKGRAAAEVNGNSFEIELNEPLADMVCDCRKVEQVVVQVVENAAKYTQNGAIKATVSRVAGADGEQIVLAVSDTGQGIAAECLPSIFDNFGGAGDDASSSKYGGAGLGLALSHKLCRLMGGSISVESAVGVGSTFTIVLPATPPAGDADNEEDPWDGEVLRSSEGPHPDARVAAAA